MPYRCLLLLLPLLLLPLLLLLPDQVTWPRPSLLLLGPVRSVISVLRVVRGVLAECGRRLGDRLMAWLYHSCELWQLRLLGHCLLPLVRSPG